MNLTPVQQQIVDTPGNLIVRASAGTGKTHTMVAKIATEIEHNHTHKSIAAITFTIKAAQEIKDRLTIDSSRHFIGTNNSFVIEEIIKPFLKDVYGAEFEVDKSIWNKPNFHKVFMGDNFRSCQQIQNYSNLLCEETRGLYNPTESLGNIIWITPKQQEWPSEVLQYIDPQKRTALLRFRNADAENGASELSSAGNNFVFIPQLPIADITTETAWLYTAIAKYMVLPEYSVYDLISPKYSL